MPDNGIGADELAQLQRWGVGLQTDPRPEVAAAGKAILLLVEEIERLHVVVWDERLAGAPPETGAEDDVPLSLLQRVRRASRGSKIPQAGRAPDRVSTPFPQPHKGRRTTP
jgi:hypothetical protein